ncbi:hypothetical protein PR048_021369 [Dryococelus australis]|uniref:Uncharacterized protein n=1 Tax=Dryococelus australis TaxID=614101 RepID=A0ABQ9GXZ6_9NEOP|nr:hypothetical protein PR048_021369 [Dryococelus australis]
MRVSEVSVEQPRNESACEPGDPRENRRPAASSVTIPTCENPGVTRLGIDTAVKGGRDVRTCQVWARDLANGRINPGRLAVRGRDSSSPPIGRPKLRTRWQERTCRGRVWRYLAAALRDGLSANIAAITWLEAGAGHRLTAALTKTPHNFSTRCTVFRIICCDVYLEPRHKRLHTQDTTQAQKHCYKGAAVAERLDCSPPTKANWVQFPASGNRAGRRSCPAVFFSGIPRVLRPFESGAAPFSPHFILIGSQDLAVESRPNIAAQLQRHTKMTDHRTSAGSPTNRKPFGAAVANQTQDPFLELLAAIHRMDRYAHMGGRATPCRPTASANCLNNYVAPLPLLRRPISGALINIFVPVYWSVEGVPAAVFRKVLLQSRSCPGSLFEGVIRQAAQLRSEPFTSIPSCGKNLFCRKCESKMGISKDDNLPLCSVQQKIRQRVGDEGDIAALQWRVVNCCKVCWCLLYTVQSRCTQREPVTTVERGETERIPRTHKRTGEGPNTHVLWRHMPSYVSMVEIPVATLPSLPCNSSPYATGRARCRRYTQVCQLVCIVFRHVAYTYGLRPEEFEDSLGQARIRNMCVYITVAIGPHDV